MDDWIKKMWQIHTIEYNSAFKENAILPYATTWVNLNDIMLSDMSVIEGQLLHDSIYMKYIK